MIVSKITRETQIFNYLVNRKRGRETGRVCPMWKAIRKPGDAIRYVDCMHHRYPDWKMHRKKCPLFIDSMLNQVPVNNALHIMNGNFRRIRDREAMNWEAFLRRQPTFAAFVTGRIPSMVGEFGRWSVKYNKNDRPYLTREAK